MREKILTFIENNSRIELKDLAVMLGSSETEVANEIADMEKEGIICGYHTLIDWDKTSEEKVTALIEVKVTPQRGLGFDKVAERIYNYPEVYSVYLISGSYDLLVTIEGKTLKEVSRFVSEKLSPIDEFICQIEVPENKTCHYQWLNASAQPIETHEQGMRILTWTLKKVPPRPYSYPSLHGKLGLAQQVASGMAPVLIATTWNKYADALTSLRQQFVPGNPDIVRAKVQELIQNQKENASDIHQAIARYMNRLYRQALCGVTLQAAGYRLRPASEVIRTAYGTQAELANLHAQLLQTAGLKAEVAVCGLSSKEEQVGLAGILSVIVEDENKCVNSLPGNTEACLQDYLNVTDLQGKKLSLSVCSSSETFKDTLTADKVHTQIPAEGWRILTVPTPTEVMTLYGYAANTSIHENILLPQTVNMKRETFVRLPQGFNWIDKTDKTLSNSCGEVSFRYQPETDGVTVTQMLRITRQLLTPNDYQAFYALMAEWRDGNNRTLVVKKP